MIVLRSDEPIDDEILDKVALFTDVDVHAVIPLRTARSIYEVPLLLERAGLGKLITRELDIPASEPDLADWQELVARIRAPRPELEIAIVGKYTELPDAYISVTEALKHAALHHRVDVKVRWIRSEQLERMEPEQVADELKGVAGVLVPGGFGYRGVEGKVRAIRWAREQQVPFLGLCLGLQCAVIEFGRVALDNPDANSSEFNVFTEHPVIDLMPDQADVTDKGGTMRLGLYPAKLEEGSKVRDAYGAEIAYERHRHRFEVNNAYRDRLGEAGMWWSGVSPDGRLVEYIELRDHPWFVATQAHPELKSRPEPAAPALPRLRRRGRRLGVGLPTAAAEPIREEAGERSRLRRMPGRPAARPAPNAAADPMATRTRSRVNLKTYPEQLERFLAAVRWRLSTGSGPGWTRRWAWRRSTPSTPASSAPPPSTRCGSGSAKDDEPDARRGSCCAFAVQRHAAAAVADLTERIEVAEAQAVIIWRGERIPYRQVPNRVADIANRTERNALDASYLEAVEAINPLREERLASGSRGGARARLRRCAGLIAATARLRSRRAGRRDAPFLAESETVYFAALRRYLAEIDIEQGDASYVDLEHVHPRRGLGPLVRGAPHAAGHSRPRCTGSASTCARSRASLLDIEPRPQKSPRAFCAAVNVPNDVRLVMQPRGGWDDYAALLHEGGHAEHFAHVDPSLPVPWRLLGDNSLTEGYGAPLRAPGGRARLAAPHHRHAGRRGRRLRRLQRLLVPASAAPLARAACSTSCSLHRGEDLAIARERVRRACSA